jgi:hypothetical protein
VTNELLPAGLMSLLKSAIRNQVLAAAAQGQTGAQRVQALTGHAQGTVSRWQSDSYSELPPFEVIAQLEHITQAPIVARMLAALTGHRLVPLDDEGADADLVTDLVVLTGSAAHVTATLGAALADGQVTPAGAKAVASAIGSHQKALTTLDRKLAAVKPKGA